MTFTIEVELQNLELAAPVKLSKKVAMRIEDGSVDKGGRLASSKATSQAQPKKKFSLFGGLGGSTPAAPPPEMGMEEKAASLDPAKRSEMLRRQDTHHPVRARTIRSRFAACALRWHGPVLPCLLRDLRAVRDGSSHAAFLP